MKTHGISKVFLTADALSRNSTSYATKEGQELYVSLFNDIILNSGIPFIINSESDPFSEEWYKDRGAQVLIDQLLVIESDYAIVCGSGSVTNRIIDLRNYNNRATEVISCGPVTYIPEPFKSETIPITLDTPPDPILPTRTTQVYTDYLLLASLGILWIIGAVVLYSKQKFYYAKVFLFLGIVQLSIMRFLMIN